MSDRKINRQIERERESKDSWESEREKDEREEDR